METYRPRNAPPDEPILDPIQIITNLTLIVFACRPSSTTPKTSSISHNNPHYIVLLQVLSRWRTVPPISALS